MEHLQKSWDKELLRLINKIKNRCEFSEVYEEVQEKTEVKFVSSKLKSVTSSFSSGFGLRVIKDGKIGFSSSNSLNYDEAVINSALSSSQFGPPATFSLPTKAPSNSVKLFDEEIIKLSPLMMIDIGRKAINSMKSFAPDLHCDVEIIKKVQKISIYNSTGFCANYDKTSYTFFINALRIKEGLLQVYDGIHLSKFSQDLDKILEKIKMRIRWAEKKATLSQTKLPVIFTPKSLISLLEPFKLGINGKMAQKGTSPLINKVGEKIFDDKITIFDDATLNWAPSSFPFDGEGVPAEKTVIVEDGVFKNFILDLQTAGYLRSKSTGNGLRSFHQQPAPSPTTLVIKEGEVDYQDMIKNTKCGVLVEQVIGWASNLLAGEFAGNIELGYAIENGEIIGRVKDVMISGNVYQSFKQVGALGDKKELVWGMICAPYILMDGFTIVGA